MFEDFSFTSPSSSRPPRLAADDDKPMTDCDALISPMSSRCPSPRSFSAPRFPRSRSLYFRSPQHQQQPPQQQAPTSVPFSAYDSHRLSIGTLTKKLHEHSIQNSNESQAPPSPTSPPRSSYSYSSSSRHFPGYVLTPPDTDHDDEGYASPISPSTSLSPTPQSPSLMPCPTSAPLELQFPDTDPFQTQTQSQSPSQAPDYTTLRTHRQTISRLQGQYQYSPSDIESIRRALLSAADDEMRRCTPLTTESCHPSSLPPAQEKRRRRTVSLQRSRVRSPVSPEPLLGPGSPEPLLGPGGHASGSGVGDTQMRRKSMTMTTGMSGTSSSRIEKSYYSSAERERERGRKKSEAGLRRKSLVSAALASMIESEDLC
ncbi:uncharacterized protein BDV17DRAFT_214876 [Aspergillus undulatus]|uniref:uncharacterized protein n=1 Tax=Aspergillus undulatus TaxID=1810928 RepID=UPI003CCD6D66